MGAGGALHSLTGPEEPTGPFQILWPPSCHHGLEGHSFQIILTPVLATYTHTRARAHTHTHTHTLLPLASALLCRLHNRLQAGAPQLSLGIFIHIVSPFSPRLTQHHIRNTVISLRYET